MIIDLTEVLKFAHFIWDAFGVMLAVGLMVMIPVAVIVASIIKIGETRKSKLENKGVNDE